MMGCSALTTPQGCFLTLSAGFGTILQNPDSSPGLWGEGASSAAGALK